MIRFQYENIEFDAPSSVMEMTIEQFTSCYTIIRDVNGEIDMETIKSLLSVICCIDRNIIDQMQDTTLSHLMEELIDTLRFELPKVSDVHDQLTFEIDGVLYKFPKDPVDLKFYNFRIYEDLAKEYALDHIAHFVYAMVILSSPIPIRRDKLNLIIKQLLDKGHKMSDIYHHVFGYFAKRKSFIDEYDKLFTKKDEQEHNNEQEENGLASKWGWYRIAKLVVDNGALCNTMVELDSMRTCEVLDHLVYLHDESEHNRMQQMIAEMNKK